MLAASEAQAGKGMEVALQDDGVFLYEEHYDRDLAYRQLRALGGTHLRMNILWWQPIPAAQRTQTTVPSNITYDWSVWDNAINRARDFGIKVQLDLAGDPPAWACGNLRPPYACDGYKPNRALFAHFVSAAVSHFKGRVSRYSMWNEPNWYTWISPHKQSPILYRKLYRAGYKAAKAADPDAEVVMGELAPHFQKNISMPPLEFVRKRFCVNDRLKRTRNAKKKCGRKPLKLDAFSIHPYDLTTRPSKLREDPDEVTMANINELPKLIDRLRKKGLVAPTKRKFPIYVTEYGYFVAGRRAVPENTRKRWIVQAWELARKSPRVKQMMHYVFVSPPPDSPSAYFDMGLITSSGTFRASYGALQNWLQAAAAAGQVVRPGPCSAC